MSSVTRSRGFRTTSWILTGISALGVVLEVASLVALGGQGYPTGQVVAAWLMMTVGWVPAVLGALGFFFRRSVMTGIVALTAIVVWLVPIAIVYLA